MYTRDELQKAVIAALEPGNKAEGLAQVYQIESEARLWLLPSLEIIQTGVLPNEVQFVAFQLVDRALSSGLSNDELNLIRETIWARSVQPNMPFIVNKVADVLTSLFVQMYPFSWPQYFENLLQLLSESPANAGEVVSSVLVSIHRKIGDQLFERSPSEHQRANELKDAIRTNEQESKALLQVFSVLLQSQSRAAERTLEAFAGFSQWYELQLMLPLVPLVLQNLQIPGDTCTAAQQAISSLLAKKMPMEAKLELIQHTGMLNPQILVNPLIAHAVLLETSKIWQVCDMNTEVGLTASNAANESLNSVLKSLKECEDEESIVQLIPGLSEYLKAAKVKGGTTQLPLILKTFIMKSQREKLASDDDFDETRQFLVSLQLLVAQIDSNVFCAVLNSVIDELLTANTPLALDLAVHELSVLGQLEPRTQFSQQFATLLVKISSTPVCEHPLLAVPFIDLCARHADSLLANGAILKALGCVADALLKLQVPEVQVRAFRSLHKLIRTAHLRSSDTVEGNLGQQLLTLLEPLLNLDSDTQLYELCGLLVGVSSNGEPELQKILSALCAVPDLQHLTLLSALIKGLVECSELPETLKMQLQLAAQYVVQLLEQQYDLIVPCKQIFSHVLARLGSTRLFAETTAFVEVITVATTAESINGLFSFVTQLMHAYRGDEQIKNLLTNLCPRLFTKVFEILSSLDALAKEQQGSTDTEMDRREAVSGFVQFAAHIVLNGYESIIGDALLSHLLSALAAVTSSDVYRPNQKLAVVALTKLTGACDQIKNSEEYLQTLTSLCYAVPSSLGASGDMKQVVLELAVLQHTLIQRGGLTYQQWLNGFLESNNMPIDLSLPLPQFKQQFLKIQERLNING